MQQLIDNVVTEFNKVKTSLEKVAPSLDKLAANGADLDRLLLNDLEKSVWMDVAREVQSNLTDDTIRSAVRRMPPEFYELRGAELEAILVERRNSPK